MENTAPTYYGFTIRLPKKHGAKWRPGLCAECLRPKSACWSTGEEEPENEEETSTQETKRS